MDDLDALLSRIDELDDDVDGDYPWDDAAGWSATDGWVEPDAPEPVPTWLDDGDVEFPWDGAAMQADPEDDIHPHYRDRQVSARRRRRFR